MGDHGNILSVARARLAIERRRGIDTSFSPVSLDTYHREWRRRPLGRVDLGIACLILIAALAVRSPFIIKGETLLHSDEAIVGIMAQDISEARRFPLYFYGQRYMGALEAYVIAALLPVFENPIHALRFGPALFFATLCALQYLMLTRWFGRTGGLIGAATLLAGPPMFMQWSISARGGYIEILAWGTALLWAYTEWFVADKAGIVTSASRASRNRRNLAFGAIIGSGMWVNPSIGFFILPMIVHALMNAAWRDHLPRHASNRIDTLVRYLGLTALPVVGIAAFLSLNVVWAVWVEEGRVRSSILLNMVPQRIAIGLMLITIVVAWKWKLINRLQAVLVHHAVLIFGVLIGAAPAIGYVVMAVMGFAKMDPALPLGFRPLWKMGETLIYLWHGLPLLFGADPRPFERLVCMGREPSVRALGDEWSRLMSAANWTALAAICTIAIIFLCTHGSRISKLLRIARCQHPPAVLLLLGLVGTFLLYLLGGCAHDFNTIRYLLPIWVFIPGLLAVVFIDRRLIAGRIAVILLLCSWGLGQWAMAGQLGAPHPLRHLAKTLIARNVDRATAEIFDAHLLTYLTAEQCKLAEHDPFWSRLDHLQPTPKTSPTYLVSTARFDPAIAWIETGFPGPPPPETSHSLWPRIRSITHRQPSRLISRTDYPMGYELIELANPLR